MMRIAILLCAVMALHVVSAAEAAPAAIKMVSTCDDNAKCVVAEINFDNLESRKMGDFDSDVCGGKVFAVRGRLNGGAIRVHHLGITLSCLDCGDGVVAMAGHSDGHPMLITAQGMFEVIDPGARVGSEMDLIAFDEATGEVIATYWGPGGGTMFHINEGKVFSSDNYNKRCFVAEPPGRVTLIVAPSSSCAEWYDDKPVVFDRSIDVADKEAAAKAAKSSDMAYVRYEGAHYIAADGSHRKVSFRSTSDPCD